MHYSGFSHSSPPPSWRAPLARQGVAAPANWRYQDIEYRGSMILPLLVIPAIRYTQDTPEDRNALLARDVAALGSATAIYLFLQKVFSNGIHQLSKTDVQNTLPGLVKGVARTIGADVTHQKFKNQFYSYIPAQIISLLTSAFVGPAIGKQGMAHLDGVKQFMACHHKKEHLKHEWKKQSPEERSLTKRRLTAGTLAFAALTPLAYSLMRHSVHGKYPNVLLRAVDHDIPALMTSLLASIGIAQVVAPKPQSPNAEKEPSLKGRVKDFFVRDKHDPAQRTQKLKAPAIGAALLGATYSTALLGSLGYVAINRNSTKQLDKFLNYETAYHALHWVLPSLLLPTIRYTQDPKDRRDEYYIRDFTHFWLGTLVYWATKQGIKPLLHKTGAIQLPHASDLAKAHIDPAKGEKIREDAVKLAAATGATLLQIASNGFLAPKFSHQFVTYLNKPEESSSKPRTIKLTPPLEGEVASPTTLRGGKVM